jgi:hypothetical protein
MARRTARTGSPGQAWRAIGHIRRRCSRMPSFWHDPALNVPPLPDLAPALAMPAAKDDVARRGTLRAHLTRGQNRLIWALEQASEVVEEALNP